MYNLYTLYTPHDRTNIVPTWAAITGLLGLCILAGLGIIAAAEYLHNRRNDK